MAERRIEDPKVKALREARSLNPRPEAVIDEAFSTEEFFDPRDLVQVKYEMVRRVRVEGAAGGRAPANFGFSRPSWYAAADALDSGGLPGLVPARPGPRRAHKLTEEIVDVHGPGPGRRSVAPPGRPGRPGRRTRFSAQCPPAFGRTCPSPPPAPQKWPMTAGPRRPGGLVDLL